MTPHEEKTTWVDMLNREYDFVLEALPEDPGPREEILPFNPGDVEKLGIKKGDVLVGQPAWVGCPASSVRQGAGCLNLVSPRRSHAGSNPPTGSQRGVVWR